MSGNRPVLLAVLVVTLALAPVTQATAAASPAADRPVASPPAAPPPDSAGVGVHDGTVDLTQNDTSNYLGLRDQAVEQSALERASLDVAGAVQQDVTELQSEYSSLTLEQRYENATDRRARMAVLQGEVDRLERRVQRLEIRRNRVLDNYNAGETETDRFLRELAAIDAAARGVAVQFERLRDTAGFALSAELNTKLRNLEGDLLTLRGPVRLQTAQAMAGQRAPVSVYAVTSQTGIVLASKEGSQYYREAYLGQSREETGPNQFVSDGDPSGVSTANSRATELYPWVYDNIRSGPNVEIIGNTSVYYVQLGHPQGSLDTYLDGRTGSAFREFQVKQLSTLPGRTTANESNGLRLTVNRTHATGPMELTVADSATAGPVDATVRINGETVGQTGSDGRLWALTPHQGVRIEVTADGRTVTERFLAD